MTAGTITLDGFKYGALEAQKRNVGPDGQPTGEPMPLKVLTFIDLHGGLHINIHFTPEDFTKFAEIVREAESKIITPARLQPSNGLIEKVSDNLLRKPR